MDDFFDPYSDSETLALIRRFENMTRHNEPFFFDVNEFEEIIDYYFYKNDNRKASICIRHSLEQHPGNVNLVLKQAQFFINANKNDKALQLLAELDPADDHEYEICMAKGNLFSQLE